MQYFEAHPVTYYKDADGKTPEILLVDGNRTGGKTTGISRLLVDEFLRDNKKFMLIYRYKNDLKDVADAFFKDIKGLFFQENEMTGKAHANGAFIELFIDKKSCGYAVPLSMVSKLKRYSHIFNDVENMFFDEYQDEAGFYLPDEVQKLVSLHTTVARGHGQAVRFVPIYMCSNSVSIFNPYYTALGLTSKINSKTKVYRGEGFVLLRLTIHDVAAAQRESSFNRAFSSSGYLSSAIDNSFLNDDTFNVVQQKVSGSPVFVFYYCKTLYSVYRLNDTFYIRKGGDSNTPTQFGVLESDRGDGVTAIRNSHYWGVMRSLMQDGCIYFADVESKRAFMLLIG